MKQPRILLADDHKLLLDGIKLMLDPEFELVGVVENGHALIAAAQELTPDLILLDISMPLLNGLDAAGQLRKLLPETKLIFVTMHEDADFVIAGLRAGAAGYVVKRAAASELLTAIREVLKGHYYVSPLIAREAIDLFLTASTSTGKLADNLTARQREVLQLVAEGLSRKEMAAILNISIKTVEFHKAALMRELNLHKPSELTRYAIEHGLITAERR